MNGIRNLCFVNQQTSFSLPQKTKSLGFGTLITDENDNLIKVKKSNREKSKSTTDSSPECPVEPEHSVSHDDTQGKPANRFLSQILANQQLMIGLLKDIDTNTKPKNGECDC